MNRRGANDFLLPFPDRPSSPRPAAERLKALAGARVALLDNGRMSFPAYAQIGSVVRAALQAERALVVPLQFPTRTSSLEDIPRFAGEAKSRDIDAAVIGLAESGITQATVQLAIGLESIGVPTVTLCADPGVSLARTVGAAHIAGIRLVDLGLKSHHSAAQAAGMASAMVPEILSALTRPDSASPADGTLFPAAAVLQEDWSEASERAGLGEAALEFLRVCERHRVGDGLPLIPPARGLVEDMLAGVNRPRHEILVPPSPPSGCAITIELAAVNAVMAGCEPGHFPVIVAALQAMAAPRYRLHQAAITTHPGTNVILVSGALAGRAGIASGAGCFGPGQRANLAIGRAVNLCMMNVLRSLPGVTDLGTFGSAAEIGTCFADRAYGDWPALHTLLGGEEASTVTVHRCEAPRNFMDHISRTAEGLLGGIAAAAASIASNNAYYPAELLVVISPDHADIIQSHGWRRADVQHYLYESARNERALLEGRGIHPVWPAWFGTLTSVPVVEKPDDILVAVAGGPGPHSMVAVPWGLSRASTVVVA